MVNKMSSPDDVLASYHDNVERSSKNGTKLLDCHCHGDSFLTLNGVSLSPLTNAIQIYINAFLLFKHRTSGDKMKMFNRSTCMHMC